MSRRGIYSIYVCILHKKENMQKEAAEQENERKQHRNQIKQIWNFTADEQENLFHTDTHTPDLHLYVCMYYINTNIRSHTLVH